MIKNIAIIAWYGEASERNIRQLSLWDPLYAQEQGRENGDPLGPIRPLVSTTRCPLPDENLGPETDLPRSLGYYILFNALNFSINFFNNAPQSPGFPQDVVVWTIQKEG
jgi:hypothetical protein